MTPDPAPRRPPDKLPDWFPAWASQLADLYFSGTTAAFVLHGNTYDLFQIDGASEPRPSASAKATADKPADKQGQGPRPDGRGGDPHGRDNRRGGRPQRRGRRPGGGGSGGGR